MPYSFSLGTWSKNYCTDGKKVSFLAHLREPMQSCGVRRPSSSSSVSRARFVTAGAIDPKLCTYVPLGKSNSQTKFSVQSDS
jgi:hypothetical protein